MNKDSTEEQVAQETPRASLDTWSWIARARQAAARAVEPVAPGAELVDEPVDEPIDQPVGARAAEPDSYAD